MNRERIKLCALCENRIPDTHVVCQDHYRAYIEYKDEQWFLELIEAQRRQAHIDRKEVVTIHKLSENTLSIYLSESLRAKSKPMLPREQIIALYEEGYRAYEIAKILHMAQNKVRVVISRHKRNNRVK